MTLLTGEHVLNVAFERGRALGFNATQVTFLRRALVALAPAWVFAVECAASAAGPAIEPSPEAAVAHDEHEEDAREAMVPGDREGPPSDATIENVETAAVEPPDAIGPSEGPSPQKPTSAERPATQRAPEPTEVAEVQPGPEPAPPDVVSTDSRWHPRSRTRPRWMSDRMYAYLTRPLDPSARHLDHGVLQVAVAGGVPHRYRVEVAVGILDHLSLGVTAHWLPGQERPQVSPRVAVAFYRWRWIEVGALHFWSMHPPPSVDADPETLSFQRQAQWVLGTATFSQRFISAGVDAGAVRVREVDDSVVVGSDLRNPSTHRWHFGGGLHLRAGTRRWGITAQAHVPNLTAEIVLDVRFGAFELRRRGGWRSSEVVRSTDRRLPRR